MSQDSPSFSRFAPPPLCLLRGLAQVIVLSLSVSIPEFCDRSLRQTLTMRTMCILHRSCGIANQIDLQARGCYMPHPSSVDLSRLKSALKSMCRVSLGRKAICEGARAADQAHTPPEALTRWSHAF